MNNDVSTTRALNKSHFPRASRNSLVVKPHIVIFALGWVGLNFFRRQLFAKIIWLTRKVKRIKRRPAIVPDPGIMSPSLELTSKISMRPGDFQVVDDLRGWVNLDGWGKGKNALHPICATKPLQIDQTDQIGNPGLAGSFVVI